MKIHEFTNKTTSILHDNIAFKWIKVDKLKANGLDIYLPENIVDKGGEGRLGHRYTCEAIAVGPFVHEVKPGDKFLLHEYDKVDNATPWDDTEVMFCQEKRITCMLPDGADTVVLAREITDKMMDEYESY